VVYSQATLLSRSRCGCPEVLAHWQVSCAIDIDQVQLATGFVAKYCTDHVKSYVHILLKHHEPVAVVTLQKCLTPPDGQKDPAHMSTCCLPQQVGRDRPLSHSPMSTTSP